MGIRITYQPDAPSLSWIKQYVLAESMQSGESKGKATAVRGPRSASLGGDLLLISRIPGLCGVIYGSTKGALSHVLSQISKLSTAPSILSSELRSSALKVFEGMYVSVLQERRVGQNISMDKSFLAGFFRSPCTLIWCKIRWLQSKDPGSSTHQALSSGLAGVKSLTSFEIVSKKPIDLSSPGISPVAGKAGVGSVTPSDCH